MNVKRRWHFVGASVLAAAVAVAMATQTRGDQFLYRISSDVNCGAGQGCTGAMTRSGETSTSSVLPDYLEIYNKSIFASGNRTYITFNAQADVHSGSTLMLGCYWDGVPCEVASGAADAGPDGGYSTMQNVGGNDWHDNSITKVWCLHNHSGTHTVSLRMASGGGGDTSVAGGDVFFERPTVTIDGSASDANFRCPQPGS